MRSCWKAAPALLMTLVVPAPASAGVYNLSITPSAAQTSRYDRGTASIESVQKTTVVRVVNVAGNDKKSVSFVIGIANVAGQSFNFGPENVTIRPSGTRPIALATYEDAMEAERKKQKREKFRAGLAAFGRALSASNAGATYNNGFYSGAASGFVEGNLVTAQTSGIYSGTQYNSGAALAAQRNAQEMNAADRANLEERWAARSALNNNLLRTTTVDPGMMYGGIATFPLGADLGKAQGPISITIEVEVAGEKHVFLGRLSEAE